MLRCFGAKRSCHLNLGMLELEATQGQFGLTAEHRKQEHLESPASPFLHLMLGPGSAEQQCLQACQLPAGHISASAPPELRDGPNLGPAAPR